MKIAFIGNFSKKKGSELFAQIVTTLQHQHQWYILGYLGDEDSFDLVKPYLRHHEAYEDGQLPALLRRHHIDLGLMLSIWPETFSKTFFETIEAGVPCMASEYGFPATTFPNWPLICHVDDQGKSAVELIEHMKDYQENIEKELAKIQMYTQESADLFNKKYELVNKLV